MKPRAILLVSLLAILLIVSVALNAVLLLHFQGGYSRIHPVPTSPMFHATIDELFPISESGELIVQKHWVTGISGKSYQVNRVFFENKFRILWDGLPANEHQQLEPLTQENQAIDLGTIRRDN